MPFDEVVYCEDPQRWWFAPEMLSLIKQVTKKDKAQVLISPPLWRKKVYEKQFVANDAIVLADSGGFQFYMMPKGRLKEYMSTRELNYRLQVKVGDYIVGGDMSVPYEITQDRFKFYVDMTKENFALQFSLDPNLKDKFINVLHGMSYTSASVWYDAVKDFPHAGWAVGSGPPSPKGYGPFSKILFLYEKGELDKCKILHIFKMSARNVVRDVAWLLHKLNYQGILSADSSSFSLGRVGRIWTEDGDAVLYSDIRAKKCKVKLLSGTVLEDVPRHITNGLFKDMFYTSMVNFLDRFLTTVYPYFENSDFEPGETVQDVYKWWKVGGCELLWERYCGQIKGRGVVELEKLVTKL